MLFCHCLTFVVLHDSMILPNFKLQNYLTCRYLIQATLPYQKNHLTGRFQFRDQTP
jgi:hypothetical protein